MNFERISITKILLVIFIIIGLVPFVIPPQISHAQAGSCSVSTNVIGGGTVAVSGPADWGSVSVGQDADGYFAILENSEIYARYGYYGVSDGEHVIQDLIIKSASENQTGEFIDASANRGTLKNAAIVYDGADKKTVRLEWHHEDGIQEMVQEVSIFRDSGILQIDYIKAGINIVDRGAPGGGTGDYVFYGAGQWIRGYDLYPASYYNRYGPDNINDPADGGSLNYNGYFIGGVVNASNDRGIGRVMPVANTEIIKLLDNEGFEFFTTGSFTGYLFVVTGGQSEVISLGSQIADGVLPNTETIRCNDPVEITAMPYSGWAFDAWGGSAAGTSNPTTIIADGDEVVTASFALAGSVYNEDFESYNAGGDPLDWYDSQAFNSLVENQSLHQAADVNGESVFGTLSTETNIHSHYNGVGSDALANYEYTGRMLNTEFSGGIGVTFLSQYPQGQSYYRLRRYGNGSFHLSPFGTSLQGTTDTGVIPVPNAWYRFRIQVLDTGSQTDIRASVWPDGTAEPDLWQVYAYDDSPSRLTAGTVGVWSFNPGEKYWDELSIDTQGSDFAQLSVATSGAGSVSVDPDQATYAVGDMVTLTPVADPGWEFSGWGGDAGGNAYPLTVEVDGDKNINATFIESPILSDDFNSCTFNSSLWSFVNPAGDATMTVTGEGILLSLPAGTTHDTWGSNASDFVSTVPRIEQAVDNTDFEIEVKFENTLSADVQMEGILVGQDANDMLRLEFVHKNGGTDAFVASFNEGVPSIRHDDAITNHTPLYMKVARSGDTWTQSYSDDGSAWTVVTTFTHAMTVNTVSVYAGNNNAASDATIDYLFNSSTPIVPEDVMVHSVTVSNNGLGSVTRNPDKAIYTCGDVVELTAVPDPDWQFSSWSDDAAGSTNPVSLVVDAPKDVTATFTSTGPASSLVSDDFNSCTLDSGLWSYVDPVGDATMSMTGEGVVLSLPAGTVHDTWGSGPGSFSSTVPRIRQSIDDTDFEMIVKFDGELDTNDQMEGILVEQDANDMLRIEFLYNSWGLRAFAASVTDGAANMAYYQTITSSTPIYMKVTRVGDTWTQSYSSDGSAWTDLPSFTHALTVNAVGVYAGNSGAATDVVIDYVFNSASPITPEDATVHTVAVSEVGSGTVSKSPDQASYACGDVVTVTAVPDAGWEFSDWSGAISGAANPATVTVSGGTQNVTATFQEPIATYNLNTNTAGSGSVTKNPDKAIYDDGDVVTLTAVASAGWAFSGWSGDASGSDSPLAVTMDADKSITATFVKTFTLAVTVAGSGSVTLDPDKTSFNDGEVVTLTPAAGANQIFSGWSGDASGGDNPLAVTMNADKNITANFTQAGVLLSDDFNICVLNSSVWTFVDPLGDTTMTSSGKGVILSLPAGTTHDTWGSGPGDFNSSVPRIKQNVDDSDFEMIVKFEGTMTSQYQMEGVLVEQDANDMLRLEFVHDGVALSAFAASVTDGAASMVYSQAIPDSTPIYMKVKRIGDTWTQSYSSNGTAWTDMTSFTHAMVVNEVGVYAGNSSAANDVIIDYVFNSASPILPEDAAIHTVAVTEVGSGTVSRTPDQTSYLCGETVTLAAEANGGHIFDGWSGALNGSVNPETITIVEGTQNVTATFVETGLPTYTLSANAGAGGSVAVNPVKTVYDENEGVTLTAVADAGYAFSAWSGDAGGSSNPLAVTMDADKSITATFVEETPAGSLVSDDFNSCALAGEWSFVDPLGDTTMTLSGEGVILSLPAGTTHDTWGSGPVDFSSTVPRIKQTVSDSDFEMVVKFEGTLSAQYQMEGILIEQDANDMLRLEFLHDGVALSAFVASVTDGAASMEYSQVIPDSTPIYMKVKRIGDTWTQSYSSDGAAWTDITSFTHAMVVNEVGVYAGNSSAANDVIIDYVFNSASPIAPEDAAVHTVNVTGVGSGTVSKSPDQPIYACGDVVTLTAVAEGGWAFDGWSGALSGSTNPASVTVSGGAQNITATFVATGVPTYTLGVVAGAGGSVTVNPVKTVYDENEVVTLTAVADAGYAFSAWSGDAGGSSNPLAVTMDADKSITATFVEETPAGSLVSDDFNSCALAGEWSFVDPLGDTTITLSGEGVILSLPAGTTHDTWGSGPGDFNSSVPRIKQNVDDSDFEMIVKFEGTMTSQYQMEGVLVEQDANDMLRLEFVHDGVALSAFVASVTDGAASMEYSQVIADSTPIYMKVKRIGDTWTQSYSSNGTAWTDMTSFTHAMVVNEVGVYAGNSSAANDVIIDYVFNSASPIAPEDAAAHTVAVTEVGSGTVSKSPDQTGYACGDMVTLTAVADAGWLFSDWSGALSGGDNPAVVTVSGGTQNVTATFVEITSATFILGTDVAGNGSVTLNPDKAFYLDGEVVSVTAVADAGWAFSGWSGDAGGSDNPLSVTMDADKIVTATFTPTTSYSLVASVTGSGSVTKNPDQASYNPGDVVTLTAAADSGFAFVGWSGDASGSNNPLSVTMDGDKNITAAFVEVGPPVIDVWYGTNQTFGQPGDAQYWVNILGNVTDLDGTVSSLEYSLNSGPAIALGIGPDERRLAREGDFNIDLDRADLNNGANDVAITATDNDGNSSTTMVTVNYNDSSTWPLPHSIDWSSVASLQDVVQVVDGNWDYSSAGARLSTQDDVEYDRVLAIGDIDWTDYEITVPITIHWVDPDGFQFPSISPGFGITLRWQGHTDSPVYCPQPHCGWLPSGVGAWYDIGNDGPLVMGGATDPSVSMNTGDTYYWKMRVETVAGVGPKYSLKVWESSQVEPAGWLMTKQNDFSDLASGSAIIIAHHVDITVGDVLVESLVDGTADLTLSTSGNGSISKDPDKTSYDIGEAVTLTAVPEAGWEFSGWSGDASGSNNPLSVTMNADKNITATFTEIGVTTYTLGVNTTGSGSVTINPIKPVYNDGEIVTLTPLADSGWEFSGWSGDASGSDNPLSVTMDANKSITATFTSTAPASSLVSDDFNSCTLDSGLWSYVDPVGDATMSMTGEGVVLSLPAGTVHDTWGSGPGSFSSTVPRIRQSIDDTDFEMIVKFDGELDTNDQMEGILVEQDANDMLRIEFLYNSWGLRAFAASVTDGAANMAYYQTITSSTPMYMKVTRVGDTWTQSYSSDGSAWTDLPSFTHALTVNAVGVYAGNSGAATDVVIDYVFNSASPITPEDATVHTVAVSEVGSGTVSKSPDQASYACGDVVTVTAVPDAGWAFDSWSGVLSGSTNPEAIAIVEGTQNVTATFIWTGLPTYTLNASASAGGGVTVDPVKAVYDENDVVTLTAAADAGWVFSGWSGDAIGSDNPLAVTMDADKNITASFVESAAPTYTMSANSSAGGSVVVDPVKAVYNENDLVTLTAAADAGYEFSGWSGDASGSANPLAVTMDADKDITATFSLIPPADPLVSDDFNSCTLDSGLWTFFDPAGDATMTETGEGIMLSLPAGTIHDTWGNDAASFGSSVPRISQLISDSDFEMEVKFDGALDSNDQMEGVLIEQDENDMLRLEFLYNSGGLRAFAAGFTDGAFDVKHFSTIFNSTPMYMKVVRSGDTWTQYYSSDGSNWALVNSFTHAMTVNKVSVYAGNSGAAVDVIIDYVFNSASPISPEDAIPQNCSRAGALEQLPLMIASAPRQSFTVAERKA